MLGVEPDQDVAQNNRSEEITDWNKETLVQLVAQLLQAEHVKKSTDTMRHPDSFVFGMAVLTDT